MATSKIPVTAVESRQISDIGFAPDTGTIAVFFKQKNGRSRPYHYTGRTQAEFDAFSKAESRGNWFNTHLKAGPFEKIVETDDERAERKRTEEQTA
jgi:hypothetical protein